jgi:polyisoprenoid-binding protein YceI
MKLRSRVVALTASAVTVGGLALAPALVTATPAAASTHSHVHWYVNVSASTSGGSTYTCETVIINGVVQSTPGQQCPP